MDADERRRALRAQYPALAQMADRIREVVPGAVVKYVGPARPESVQAMEQARIEAATPRANPSGPTPGAGSASRFR